MAWNQGKAKENSNPTILSVRKERSHVGFEWSEMGTFEKREQEWIPTSATDVAIFKALMDTANATRGRNVNVLENAGMTFNTTSIPKKRLPSFKVFSSASTADSKPTAISREKISSEEIFDIIRTVQDPEHPNTLEELGVVSLAQVQVLDQPESISSVAVRFT